MSRSHFAYRARHGMRSHAWRSVISRDTSLAEDLFARGGRCAARPSGLAGLPSRSRTASMRGEFITRCTTRYALHSQHRKSVWEVVQAFGRVVSAKSYNFDGPTFVGKPGPSGVGTSTPLLGISSISQIGRLIFRVNPRVKYGDLIQNFVSNKVLILCVSTL